MELNSKTIGLILILIGLFICLSIWIGMITPNMTQRTMWIILITIFWAQLQEISKIFWVGSTEFENLLLAVTGLIILSMPLNILGIAIDIFFYFAIALIIAGIFSVFTGAR
ncbi:MAG: hypothetical protein ACTSO2_17825 [Promethearchaeota archaeon]